MSDVGFDSNKHDLTRQDAQKGAESLQTAADAINTFADAQVESVWGEEAGVDAARRALQDSYFVLRDGFKGEREHFLDFGTKVDQSEKEFLQMEEQNADYSRRRTQPWSRILPSPQRPPDRVLVPGRFTRFDVPASPSESQDNTDRAQPVAPSSEPTKG